MLGAFLRKYFKSTTLFIDKASALKVDSVEENQETGLLYLIIRISGKCTPPISIDPYKLLVENSNKKSNLFSNDDYCLIINTMLENQRRIIEKKYIKKYLLIKHTLSEQTGELLIVYKNILINQFFIKNIKEVFSDINLINNFDSKDSALIGYLVGSYEKDNDLNSKSTGDNQTNVISKKNIIPFKEIQIMNKVRN